MNRAFEVVPVGEAAVMVVLGQSLDAANVRRSRALARSLRAELGRKVLDVVPAFASVLVRFDPLQTELAAVMAVARGAAQLSFEDPALSGRRWEVAVCFDAQYGIDLEELSRTTGLTPRRITSLFCSPRYEVAFLGFLAGFPYLLGLPARLAVPRLQTPRALVPAGSVAVADGQCGVYSQDCPGAWNLLGRTAARIFDASKDPPALFAPGDEVRFLSVSRLQEATARLCA